MKYVTMFILLIGCDCSSALDLETETQEDSAAYIDTETGTETETAVTEVSTGSEAGSTIDTAPAICDLLTAAYGVYCEDWPYTEGQVGTCGRVMNSAYECLLSCADMYSERCAAACERHHVNYMAYCPDDWRY